jgi:hypothetical protein
MELLVKREASTEKVTMGKLYLDGVVECDTLEDIERVDPNPETPENEAKVAGATAIPCGRYRVFLTWSPHFGRILPELQDVPGFAAIRIHAGNTEADTRGCLLVGERDGDSGRIKGGTSRVALERLLERIAFAINRHEEVWITYEDAAQAVSA